MYLLRHLNIAFTSGNKIHSIFGYEKKGFPKQAILPVTTAEHPELQLIMIFRITSF